MDVVIAVGTVVAALAAIAAALAAFMARNVAADVLAVEEGRDERDAEAQVRAQAERVSVTLTVDQVADEVPGSSKNFDVGTVTVYNRSDLPVRAAAAYIAPREEHEPVLKGLSGPAFGDVPPGATVMARVAHARGATFMPEGAPENVTWVETELQACTAWLYFHDAAGKFWLRDGEHRLRLPG